MKDQLDEETQARIVGMKRAGIAIPEIARKLGLQDNQIRNICRRRRAYSKLNHKAGTQPFPRGNTRLLIEELGA